MCQCPTYTQTTSYGTEVIKCHNKECPNKEENMKDTRDCPNCIYHDGSCIHWDCTPITRKEAEYAVKTLRDLAERFGDHNMVCAGDIIERAKS